MTQGVPVHPDALREAIADSTFFAALPPATIEELIPLMDGVLATGGERVIAMDDDADALFLVRHGRLRTSVTGDDGQLVVLGEIGRGEVVGEMALLTNARRSADVYALRDTLLYRLPAPAFTEMLVSHPELMRSCASVIVDRYRRSIVEPPPDGMPATIAIVAPEDLDGLQWFLSELERALGEYRVAVTRAVDVGERDPAALLLEIESAHDIVLLVAGNEPDGWAKQCLRHADSVLRVGASDHTSGLYPIEADHDCNERIEFLDVIDVHLHHGRPDFVGWGRVRDVRERQNIAIGNSLLVDRLSRRISGTETVFVLSGGAARAMAHFGVLEVLHDSGIHPDVIVGTSAGSLVGGLLAMYPDVRSRRHAVLEWFAKVKWRRDFTAPVVALTSGKMIMSGLEQLYEGALIENLDVDYHAVSTNLTTGDAYVHTTGYVAHAVRASTSIPGVFPPVHTPAGVLVDGGLLDNLPVALARSLHPTAKLIAIDVGGGEAGVAGGVLGPEGIVNGWKVLAKRSRAPTLPRVLMRLTELGQVPTDPSMADAYIRPEVGDFGRLDPSAAEDLIQRGRDAAFEWLDATARADRE